MSDSDSDAVDLNDAEEVSSSDDEAPTESPKKTKRIKKRKGDDLGNMTMDFFNRINFKVSIFLFLFGIFIFSDMFIESVLTKLNGVTDANETNTKGTVIQLLCLVLFYIFVDLLVQGDII